MLFLASGFAAVLYQVVWQRALAVAFGMTVEASAIIVAVFMLGLGIGSLLGGELARRFPDRLPALFLGAECAIGLYGLLSLPLVNWLGTRFAGEDIRTVAAIAFGVFLVPTVAMGTTLPILVTYLHRAYRHVGRSLGLLYALNTLGSAVASFAAVHLLFAYAGQRGTTWVAAAFNLSVGYLAYRFGVAKKSRGALS